MRGLPIIGHHIGVAVFDRGMESSGGDELERSRRAAPGQLNYGLAYLFVILWTPKPLLTKSGKPDADIIGV
jgi:hypothetical protein